MVIFLIPALTASSMTYWIRGLSTSGSISLGCAFVAGRNRVPSPAAGKTAFDMRIFYLFNHCADAEPARPIEEMKGDGRVPVEPFTKCSFSRHIRVAFVGPVHEERFSDNFIPGHKSPVSAVVAIVAVVSH